MAAGDHEHHHGAQRGIVEIELPLEAKAETPECRHLHGKLRDPAEQHAEAPAVERPLTKVGVMPILMRLGDPREERAADDRNDVEDRAGAGRQAEDIPRIEHAHRDRRDGDEEDEGKEQSRHRDGHGELAGNLMEPVTGEIDHERRKGDAHQADDAEDEDERGEDELRQFPRGVRPFLGPRLRERGGEGGGKRALGEEIAEKIRDAECREEDVG